jgi:hypothetical protein
MATWREIKGAYGRRRRALRQAVLEPLLVGWPMLRDTVMRALAARGQLVFCELGDARFFVDPADQVIGARLIWHGGWQRREIDQAVAMVAASGRLPPDAVFVDVGAISARIRSMRSRADGSRVRWRSSRSRAMPASSP